MKCDKLKSLKNLEVAFNTTTNQDQVIAEDSEGNCYGFDSWEEVYLKDEVDAVIDELKTENESLLQQNRELCLALQVMYSKEEYDKQKAKADKLLSCLKCLVMLDLIKDCPPKKTAAEIVEECENGVR